MSDEAVPSWGVERLSPDWQAPALELFLKALSPEVQAREIQRLLLETDSLAGLLGVVEHGRLLGAVWTQVLPGRVATIWPPRLTEPAAGLGDRLAIAAVEVAAAHGARLVQAQIPLDEVQVLHWLRAAGMHPVAEVESLMVHVPHRLADAAAGQPRGSACHFEAYEHPRHLARLEELLSQTSADSLDCPALNEARDMADMVAGYLAAGTSGAAHWQLLRDGDVDAGCLLLNETQEVDEMELVYMGLAPAWRRQGWGHALVERAMQLAHRAGRSRLLTNVDRANLPARAVYASAGFICWDRRLVLLRTV